MFKRIIEDIEKWRKKELEYSQDIVKTMLNGTFVREFTELRIAFLKFVGVVVNKEENDE